MKEPPIKIKEGDTCPHCKKSKLISTLTCQDDACGTVIHPADGYQVEQKDEGDLCESLTNLMKPENKLWALTMLRAIQQALENEGIEDLRTDDEGVGEKLEDLIATIEDARESLRYKEDAEGFPAEAQHEFK